MKLRIVDRSDQSSHQAQKRWAFHQLTPQNALISPPTPAIRGVRRMYARLDEQRAAR